MKVNESFPFPKLLEDLIQHRAETTQTLKSMMRSHTIPIASIEKEIERLTKLEKLIELVRSMSHN